MGIEYDDDVGLHEVEGPALGDQWVNVAGYEGLYEINGEGEVRSPVRRSPSGKWIGGKLLSPNRSAPLVSLCKNGVRVWEPIANLMALSWAGPYKKIIFVDGDNNNVSWDNMVIVHE